MECGFIEEVRVCDDGETEYHDAEIRGLAHVRVDFVIDRSVLFEFMDALRPIDPGAVREPIRAILDHSATDKE